MAPSIDDFGGKVNPATLLEFVDNGGTIFAATDTTVGEVLRELAAEVGVEIDEAGTKPGIDFFWMISSIVILFWSNAFLHLQCLSWVIPERD